MHREASRFLFLDIDRALFFFFGCVGVLNTAWQINPLFPLSIRFSHFHNTECSLETTCCTESLKCWNEVECELANIPTSGVSLF